MSCVNPNDPEFKRLLAITGNPLLAEIEFNKRENLEKGFDTGVSELFESNPELANAVYETITPFKTSKQKQLFYHVDKRTNLNEETLVDDFSQVYVNGVFFTDSIEYAKKMAAETGGIIYEAFLDIQSPLNVDKNDIQFYGRKDLETLQKEGNYDSAIHYSKDSKSDKYGAVGNEVVVYEPAQIKLITPQQKQQALQLYSSYLDTIFPDSQVKDIVYHGSTEKFDKFDLEKVNKNRKAFWFGVKPEETAFGVKIPALLNIPKWTDFRDKGAIDVLNNETIDKIKEKGGNGFIGKGFYGETQIGVFEPEQIHILGNKQDIEGFKKFVEKTSAPAETVKINSTIFEQNPNITEEEIKVIYENYSNLMNKVRADKQVSYDVFRLLLNTYQVVKYKDTYIFGSYHRNTATFISRMNSSPSSKELLAEAIPNIVKQGIDVMSFIPKDYADKLTRSGYTVSKKGFRHNFKGEDMIKYAATSNPQVFEKIFKKPFDQISGEELEAFNEDVPLVYIATEIDSKYIQKAGKDVTKILETYLSQFGILSKDISEIKDKLNIDEFGFVDLLNKIVYTKDKKNLPELAGQFIAYMMQYNPLVQDIVKTLIKTEALPLPKGSYTITESGDIKYDYKNIDKTPYFKYIGKLIAESLQNKVKGEYKNSLIDKIEELIKTFFNYITKKDLHRININIGIITDNIMQQNKKLITSSLSKPGAPNKPTQQVSVESALKKDKFGADIIYELAKKGFILTGSTALSEQGTILRPDENPLHDIDWVSPFNRAETVALFLDSYPDALKVRDIVNNEYVTDSFLITPANYHIGNYETVTYDEKIIIKQYDVLDSNNQVAGTYRLVKNIKTKGNDEVVTGVEAKVIDFFSYEDYALGDKYEPYSYESKQGTVIKLSNWKDIFQAKLDFARYKDIWDYNRFIPNEYKTSLNEELAVYLANELKNQLDINVPLKQPNMLDILSTAKVVTQEDIDNKKLEC